jgi:lipid II:glycine glycyltransferase (peptidoglycan interpeptide bridge formation enzyme)
MFEAGSVPTPATDRWTAWDSFLEATAETGFMQSSWWADFRTTVGFEHFGVTLKNKDVIVGGAMVQKFSYTSGSCFYYIQDGPVLPQDESIAGQVFQAILENIDDRRKAEQQTVSHLRIEPRWQRLPSFVRGFQTPAFISNDRFVEPRDTLCIDLRPSEATILAQMKPKGRYNIRVAQRHDVSVDEDTSTQGIADFLRIYKRTTARQKIKAKPPSYLRTLASMLSSLQHGSVFFAEHQGARIAAALVVYFGRRATYFFGGSLVSGRRVMAPYLLHFEIMRRAKDMGHEWYDFWGVAPADQLNHPWHDISVFKRKFGGQGLNLVPTLDFVYDTGAYDDYAINHS